MPYLLKILLLVMLSFAFIGCENTTSEKESINSRQLDPVDKQIKETEAKIDSVVRKLDIVEVERKDFGDLRYEPTKDDAPK